MDKTFVHPVTKIVFNALFQRQRALAACKDLNWLVDNVLSL
jgi:hypothetical protein